MSTSLNVKSLCEDFMSLSHSETLTIKTLNKFSMYECINKIKRSENIREDAKGYIYSTQRKRPKQITEWS